MNHVNRVFTVDGQPFFPLGGQVHNSSGYNLAALDTAWKALEALDANTVEIPVYWGQVEPVEGQFDFSVLDDLLQGAREHGLKLMLLWFGTWKNGQMGYAPSWVKQDPDRFRRVISAGGYPLNVLSSHCRANLEADRRAYSELLKAIKEKDATEKTIIAVQIENEAGIRGSDRDYGPEATATFHSPVPAEMASLAAERPGTLIHAAWQAAGARESGSWPELFGWQAGEFMTAWQIAQYIEELAIAGKAVYDLPMTVNVWLGEQWRRLAGEYPSGGAVAKVLDIYKLAAPHVDLIAPDIYVSSSQAYRHACEAYNRADNPLFVPESGRAGSNAQQMFYALGEYDAIGYFCFGIESMLDPEGNLRPESAPVAASFRAARAAIPLLLAYQGTGRVHAIVQEENAVEQYLDLGDYIGWVRFIGPADRYPGGYLYPRPETPERARGLVIQADDHEFYLVGGPFRVQFKRKPAPDAEMTPAEAARLLSDEMPGMISVEEGRMDDDGTWHPLRERNGDEVSGGVWAEPRAGLVRAVLTH